MEPRWLDEDDKQTWIATASVLMRLPQVLEAQLQADAGLSLFEYLVLSKLSMTPGRTLRMSELARYAEGSLPRLSQVMSRLEKRGCARREPDPTDGRYTLAVLTDDGFAQVAAAAPGHVEAVHRLIFDPLTKAQRRQLGEINRRIMRAVDPGEGC
ncbi:MarR family transcriptional regulator [Actinoplanes sp. NBRC 103695]|uniref:MarR family winged helix-turn-helix transcriptional regulator n=1 Tax=Actinoplanes sp. NBRC 103695 TaxID=3032202 RepID=UPI0024A3EE2B|nr:MarR family transcriptional regulator [Actinoplanes sp. NBRC 103695]GLZ00232.1 MarR family transcriptional regulator [Actinoplanes sp. NBRC 103695]